MTNDEMLEHIKGLDPILKRRIIYLLNIINVDQVFQAYDDEVLRRLEEEQIVVQLLRFKRRRTMASYKLLPNHYPVIGVLRTLIRMKSVASD
ncbi:hypothetical protein [Bacillus bombysepticus]|uniref:hypothetical protein n=1 Tax=Bacillus bombysepticus TaxID=658666 RepID=UPI00301A4C81